MLKGETLSRLEYTLLQDLKNLQNNHENSEKKHLLNLQISGGMDSMCLLYAFYKVYNSKHFTYKNNFKIIVQNFNHKKRGEESDKDSELVQKTAQSFGFDFYQESADLKDFGNKNFQECARKWRKNRAFEICENLKNKEDFLNYFIVTAHHARDHVETVMLNILRGTSLKGLLGIQKFSDDNLYFRPFFNIEYEKIQSYCNKRKVIFREDSSNQSDNFDRNYLRLHVLPHFKKLRNNYQLSFQKMSNLVSEHFNKPNCQNKVLQTNQTHLTEHSTASEVYDLLIKTENSLSRIMTRNSIDNILHEVQLIYKKRLQKKEIMLASGWCIVLVKVNDYLYVEIKRQM